MARYAPLKLCWSWTHIERSFFGKRKQQQPAPIMASQPLKAGQLSFSPFPQKHISNDMVNSSVVGADSSDIYQVLL